jgi:rsbT co-antagonist protein RsbR
MSMETRIKTRIPEILRKYEKDLLADWMREQALAVSRQQQLMKESELLDQSKEFLRLLQQAAQADGLADIKAPTWASLRELLASVSRSRGVQGFTPSETATFVFSFKKPLFARLQSEYANDAQGLGQELWLTTELLDKLGLYTTEVYQKTREEVILRQQQEMMELSTPVVKLWEGVLALPLIGTLDSARTQIVMEALLQKIVETGSRVAIIDITGVPTVDTLVAQHLLKTITAARLMGADCIISGIRPQIAQTIVHLGVELGDVITKSNLADAFTLALQRTEVSRVRPGPVSRAEQRTT